MDPDVFHEPYFKFTLRKPELWSFMPAQWSPVAQLKNLEHPTTAWIKQANTPFCYAMHNHGSSHHAPSAVQVSARPPVVHNPGLASTMLESQLSFLKAKYPDFDTLAASSRASIAGYPAMYIRGTFAIITTMTEAPIRMSILSRVFAVFSPHGVFSIGLSGSSDPDYFIESDFEQILASIRIGI